MSATNVARAGKRGNICVVNNVSATMCPRLPGPSDTGTGEHDGWRDPIGGSRIKTLKMQGALHGLFSVSFFLYCDLENQI